MGIIKKETVSGIRGSLTPAFWNPSQKTIVCFNHGFSELYDTMIDLDVMTYVVFLSLRSLDHQGRGFNMLTYLVNTKVKVLREAHNLITCRAERAIESHAWFLGLLPLSYDRSLVLYSSSSRSSLVGFSNFSNIFCPINFVNQVGLQTLFIKMIN